MAIFFSVLVHYIVVNLTGARGKGSAHVSALSPHTAEVPSYSVSLHAHFTHEYLCVQAVNSTLHSFSMITLSKTALPSRPCVPYQGWFPP